MVNEPTAVCMGAFRTEFGGDIGVIYEYYEEYRDHAVRLLQATGLRT